MNNMHFQRSTEARNLRRPRVATKLAQRQGLAEAGDRPVGVQRRSTSFITQAEGEGVGLL